MKILHLSAARSWRGGEQQLAYLAEELAGRQVEQLVFCPVGSKMETWCRETGIPVQTFRKGFSLNPLVALQLRGLWRKNDIQLIHVHDNHAHTFAWLAAVLFGNKPPIIVSRRVDFSIRKSRLSMAKYLHPKIARILCVSEAIRQIVLQDFPDPQKVQVVYSGINPDRFKKSPKGQLREELGLKQEQILIGNVAAIAPHKDYFTFVETAEILLKKGLDVRFLIIGGDGGEEAIIRETILKKGLENQILLLGFRQDIPELLAELDLLLFTSKTEGLGTSLLDALASGLPIVATRGGGIPEIIRHGETGLTAEVGDAPALARLVLQMLTDTDLRAKLIAGGLDLVQSFSKSNTAAATQEIYEAVCKEGE
ncbi:MAG: glycosyltransferase family 4 protein [Saprospiraceae bacterium]|nr:glycosyltransferase family 4 protein [Saprospiraceae bacterium]